MVEWRVGCSGFSYDPWVGPFYPKALDSRDRLAFYSRVFDCVEIDSTFYRTPTRETVIRWDEVTPDDFVFTAKVPKTVTHDRSDPLRALEVFEGVMAELGDKLHCVLLQYPRSFTFEKGWEDFETLAGSLAGDPQYAVEFRHESWFTEEVRRVLRDRNVILCWSENDYVEVPPTVTSNRLYLRFIGEHQSLPPDTWGRVRRDRRDRMREWVDKARPNLEQMDHAYAFFNNHFAGFGPGSANQFRQILGMDMVQWPPSILRELRDPEQRELQEFE